MNNIIKETCFDDKFDKIYLPKKFIINFQYNISFECYNILKR